MNKWGEWTKSTMQKKFCNENGRNWEYWRSPYDNEKNEDQKMPGKEWNKIKIFRLDMNQERWNKATATRIKIG